MIYKPENFQLFEVLPKEFYNQNIQQYKDKLWLMFDYELLYILHNLRKIYGPITLNDWYWNGKNQYRGWRSFDCSTGAFISQHKFGRAFDCKFKNITTDEVREDIIKNYYIKAVYTLISCIELNTTWLHFDTRSWDSEELILITP